MNKIVILANNEAIEVPTDGRSQHNLVFWFHILITVLAWVGPFLFSWYLMVAAYLIVLIQFMIWDRCLLNSTHELNDENKTTLYSYVIEHMGYKVDRGRLRVWVREYFYVILSGLSILWQVVLGFEPLLF